MNKSIKILLLPLFLLSTMNLLAQNESAKDIVKKANEVLRGNTSKSIMAMKIVRPKWTRTVEMKSWSKGDDFSLILIQAPARDKGSSFLKRNREIWNWQPTINRTIKLPPSMMSQSWMGSDFTNDDLVRQASIVNDYTHKSLGSETINGQVCHKIELIPKPDAPVVWGKVLMWISKKQYLQMKTEMYDEDGYLVNTLLGSNVKNMGGRVVTARLEVIPADKEGHKTILDYKSLVFDQPIQDAFFSTQNMKKVK